VDFILVAVPMVMIFLATLAVVQTAYLRNLMIDAAVEGSRSAAMADGSTEAGIERSREVLSLALGNDFDADYAAETRLLGGFGSKSGQKIVTVSITKQVEFAGLLPIGPTIRAVASASLELQ